MEIRELEKALEKYYKKHSSEYVQVMTMSYVSDTYNQRHFNSLKFAILKSHPHSWGFPDVSAIETAHERFMKSGNKDLTENKTSVWRNPIPKLTAQEQEESKRIRRGWNELLEKTKNEKDVHELDKKKLNETKKELQELK